MLDKTAAKLPDDCNDMAEVRAGVDAVDAEMMRLLGRRFAYMNAAARIKPDRDHVRDEARKAHVLANAEKNACTQDVPAGFIRNWWEQLVEASIAYELQKWDEKRR